MRWNREVTEQEGKSFQDSINEQVVCYEEEVNKGQDRTKDF